MRTFLLAAALAAVPLALGAQQGPVRLARRTIPPAETRAAETITEADFRAKLSALAHDSMRGREAPGPELERAVAWVAERFRDAGLQPAGDSGTFLQDFRLRHARLDSLTITITGGGQTAHWLNGLDFATLRAPATDTREAPLMLMLGVPADSARPFGDASVRGTAVLLVLPAEQLRGEVLNPIAEHANRAGVAALAIIAPPPPDLWAEAVTRSLADRWSVPGADSRAPGPPRAAIYQVPPDAAAALLRAAGAPADSAPGARPQGIRYVPGFTFSATTHETVLATPPVANVVGMLEGSDPQLRSEAVIFTAHLDHVGTVTGGRCHPSDALPADSVCNGADDDASGTVGIIELAEAFGTLRFRPARTLLFAAVTAEERGLLGSRYYVDHPVVPIDRTAAVINLDMIARAPRDTAGLVGKSYSSLGALADRSAAEHPELRLTPAELPGNYAASDHYPFAQRGVPALFFFSGEHQDLHTTADNPDRADVGQAARIARLAFHVGLAAASAPERPVWDPQARARVVVR